VGCCWIRISLPILTSHAAKALGVDNVVGTLEVGKEADIIVIDGNPLENINDLWKVDDVFFQGNLLDRGSDASLAAVRQIPPAL
jgi:imidazolonepropionase-like amidohydrolase